MANDKRTTRVNITRVQRALGALFAAAVLAGCGGGGGGGGGGGSGGAAVPPTVLTQPAATTVADGTIANFAVAAAGDAPLAYQWRRNGVDLADGAGIAGAASATLALVAPYAFNGSQLSVRVSNPAGNVLSGNALLSVTPIAPTISLQPANVSVSVGAAATFLVATTGGTAPVTYQWRRAGIVIGGATAATYTLAAAAVGDNGAVFSVDVVNPAGTLASTTALLSVAAAGKTWGAAALISSGDILRSPGYPQVVIDSAGNAITVWQEETPGAVRRNAVWARRAVAGSGWDVAATIDQGVGNAVQPQIAITPASIAVATFMQSTANNGGGSQIMANRFSGTWGAAQRRDADAFGRATYPYVALAADGAATVVFTLPDSQSRVWASQSSAAGVWTAPVVLGGRPAFQPQVAMAANGHAIMTWLEPNSSGPFARSLWASRDIGAGWTPPVAIAAVASGVTPIRVVADANGNAIAVWQQELGGRTAIRANRLDAASGVWGTALTLNDASVHGGDPEPAMDANGNAIVVWSAANDAGAGNGVANLGVTARRFVAATGAWGSALAVQPNAPQPQQEVPHVAVDAAGNAIAVWLQRSPANGSQREVWGAHFNAAQAAWGTPLKLMTDPAAYAGNGLSEKPKVAINANGEAVVVWFQRTDAPASVGIWARVYR